MSQGVTDVLVVGDANVDLVLRGDVVPRFGQAEQLLESADLVVGGSASIVAIGLARLGVSTALVAVLGADRFGDFQRNALRSEGVAVDAVRTSPSEATGISVILSTPGDRSILTLPGTVSSLRANDVLAAVEATQPNHVHFASYFLQPGLAAELPALLAELRSRGVTTSLDTNWDPAERWAGLAEILPAIDIVFPNLEELRAIAVALGGNAGSDVDAAATIAALGPRVIVKAGRDGGWALGPDGVIARAPGLPVDVVDTTGAGDSFDAGYLAAMAAGVADEVTRLRWASVAGSRSTLGRGGTAAQATRDELLAGLARLG
jgi:ribokinase